VNSSTILLAIVACISLAGCSQQPVDGSGAAISKPVNHAVTPPQPLDHKSIEKIDPVKPGIVAPNMIQGGPIVAPDMIQRVQKVSPPIEDHKAP
jgi:hypothetical protein